MATMKTDLISAVKFYVDKIVTDAAIGGLFLTINHFFFFSQLLYEIFFKRNESTSP